MDAYSIINNNNSNFIPVNSKDIIEDIKSIFILKQILIN